MASDRMIEEYSELQAQSGEINHLNLDESILDQPQKFGHCAYWCAHYNAKRERTKHDAEVTDARVATRIRAELRGDDPKKKPTEAMVSEAVMIDPESLAAWDRYYKTVEMGKLWDAVLESFKQRSFSLSQYVHWRAGDYIHERTVTGPIERSQYSRRMRQ